MFKYAILGLFLFVALAYCGVQEEQRLFKLYMQQYNKVYSESAEELDFRFQNFQLSLRKVDELNARSKGIRYSINEHSDLSEQEWQNRFLMPQRDAPKKPNNRRKQNNNFATNITSIDWRDLGVVTPVKNQLKCGSCWAFAGTEGMETAWLLAGHGTNTTLALAPQQLVDCDSRSHGCKGGQLSGAYVYGIQVGMMSEADYPYVAMNQNKCFANASNIVARMERYNYLYDENDILKYVSATGPISVCMNATVDNWRHYHSGVMSTDECPATYQVNHCLQVVGFNMEVKPAYWIVRNSWGATWGDSGYLKLEMFKDTCGIANEIYSVKAN